MKRSNKDTFCMKALPLAVSLLAANTMMANTALAQDSDLDLALCMKRAKMKYNAAQALQRESWDDASGMKLLERVALLEGAVRELYIFLEVNLRDELTALDVPEL